MVFLGEKGKMVFLGEMVLQDQWDLKESQDLEAKKVYQVLNVEEPPMSGGARVPVLT